MAATQSTVELLATKKAGDNLVLSGMFVERFGFSSDHDKPTVPNSSDDFEGSVFTTGGSLTEPDYYAYITEIR